MTSRYGPQALQQGPPRPVAYSRGRALQTGTTPVENEFGSSSIPAQVAPSPTPELPTAVPSPASPAPTAIGDLQLTILYNSAAADPKLRAGGGFAALVEYGGHTLLFDTGPTGSFLLENMRQLNVDPQSIEAIIISHEHSDHTGGLQALLDTGIRPTVYVPPLYSSTFKEQVRARTELVEVADALTVLPGMHLARPAGSVVEQALAVETPNGTVVIVGCSHPGIVNMVRRMQEIVPGKASLLAGGFHLMDVSQIEKLPATIAELRQLGVERVLPTHCTSVAAVKLFRTEFGEACLEGGAGRIVTSSSK